MYPIDRLRDTLLGVGRAALGLMRLGDSLQIRHERDLLVQWVGGEVSPEDGDKDRIISAIEAYRTNRYLSGIRQARFACYGCVQAIGGAHYRLIEDRPLFGELLAYLARHRHRTRLFRKCYRGLLGAYFAYDLDSKGVTSDGRSNQEELRQFLDRYRELLVSTEFTPAWVSALTMHPQLLAADPCAAYGFDALRGNWSALDDISERLSIGSDSWLMRKLVFAQVDAVVALDDDVFERYIESILLLLDSHPLHAASALAMLLDRLSRCARAEVGATLGEHAVTLWGNPWLANNVQQWLCTLAARDMVARWLKRHLLQGFFSIFADDTAANRRRAEFWDIYCDDLVGMYFAMGKAAFAHRNSSYFKFRRDAKGLVVRIAEATPDLHVLILQFEQHHVVELNKNNSVAYFYETRHGTPPFYLSKGWIDIGALSVSKVVEGTSLTSKAKSLRHLDEGSLAWEGVFARELGVTVNALRNFCRKYRCWDDGAPFGSGTARIFTEQQRPLDDAAGAILAGWGYVWQTEGKVYVRQ